MYLGCCFQEITARVGAVTCWIQQLMNPMWLAGFTNTMITRLTNEWLIRKSKLRLDNSGTVQEKWTSSWGCLSCPYVAGWTNIASSAAVACLAKRRWKNMQWRKKFQHHQKILLGWELLAKVLILTTFSKVLMSNHVLQMRLCIYYQVIVGASPPHVGTVQNTIYIASFKGHGVT